MHCGVTRSACTSLKPATRSLATPNMAQARHRPAASACMQWPSDSITRRQGAPSNSFPRFPGSWRSSFLRLELRQACPATWEAPANQPRPPVAPPESRLCGRHRRRRLPVPGADRATRSLRRQIIRGRGRQSRSHHPSRVESSIRSGRLVRVRASDCSRRQAATLAW